MTIKIKRIYEKSTASDGTRILVDRLWPRGVSKEDAKVKAWLKVAPPSNELRRWFHADPEKHWKEFNVRYRAELKENRKAIKEAFAPYTGTITLITGVKDVDHSHIPALLAFLQKLGKLTGMADFSAAAKQLGVSFKNLEILEEALTHRSYLNEHKSAKAHNERLEFLGDAVLELATTHFLFIKFPNKPEGDLTAFRASLVNTVSLAETAELIGLNDLILLSKGESKDTGRARQIILANAFEAVLGAIYLDQGYDAAEHFVATHLYPKIDAVIANRAWQDAKSRFQEAAQEKRSITPAYKTLDESGPDHDKKFTVGAFLGKDEVARGEGKSKQEAEQDAAQNALKKTGW